MGSVVGVASMPKKTTSVRLTDEAVELARIASGFTGESITEYVSRIILAQAKADVDRLYAEKFGAKSEPPKSGKPPRPGSG